MAIKSFGSEMKDYSSPHHDHNDEYIADLQTTVGRLDTIVYAMWEILKENGVGEEKLKAKIREVVSTGGKPKRPSYEPVIAQCPQCGRNVQESRKDPLIGRCLFCGGQVIFYPYSDDHSAVNNTSETSSEEENG